MTKNLDTVEEYDVRELLETPELTYVLGSVLERKKVTRNVLSRKISEILLINKSGFCIDSVFAGLSESCIEYFAKHAPLEYKKEILKIFKDREAINGVWEIAKALDEDDGDGLSRNQDRIQKVMQYIQDNRSIFQS